MINVMRFQWTAIPLFRINIASKMTQRLIETQISRKMQNRLMAVQLVQFWRFSAFGFHTRDWPRRMLLIIGLEWAYVWAVYVAQRAKNVIHFIWLKLILQALTYTFKAINALRNPPADLGFSNSLKTACFSVFSVRYQLIKNW